MGISRETQTGQLAMTHATHAFRFCAFCLCMSKPASIDIPTAPACYQVLPVKHRLATKEGQPAHVAAASFSHTHSKGGPPSGLSTGHEPVRLTAVGRARCGGFLNGSLPGSAAAAAVVNLYTGHPGTSPAGLLSNA